MNHRDIQKKIYLFCAASLAAFTLVSCGGSGSRVIRSESPEGYAPRPEISRPDLIQPALNTIKNRIQSYENRIAEIKAIENNPNSMMLPRDQIELLASCKTDIYNILTNYDALQKRLLRETNLDAAQNMANNLLQQVNQQDMQFLEGDCGRLLADLRKSRLITPEVSGYGEDAYIKTPGHQEPFVAAPDPQIDAAFRAGDFNQVANLYHQNWEDMGQDCAPITTWQYCQALLKSYQVEEAARLLLELSDKIEQTGDALAPQVLRALGDIAMSNGAYQDAHNYYNRAVRLPGNQNDSWTQRELAVLQRQDAAPGELTAYADLLRAYLSYVPQRDSAALAGQAERFLTEFPQSRLIANVNEIHRLTQKDLGMAPLSPQTPEEATSSQGQNLEAEEPEAPGSETAAQVERDETPLEDNERAARNLALNEQLKRGEAQLASKDYDAAIQSFSSLLGSALDAEARQRLNDAFFFAGEGSRQKAAELFIRAKQSADLRNRKKLLLESRQILVDIPVKYPEAGLEEKVARNLTSLEAELRAVEEELARAPEQAE